MFLPYFYRVIQRSWWLIALSVLGAWTISLTISFLTTPIYRAHASLIVFPNANLTSSRDVVTSLDTLDKRSITSTYEGILTSERIFNDTVKSLNLPENEKTLYKRYTVVKPDSNTIDLYVEGTEPSLVAKITNGLGENGIRYIKGIYQVFDIAFLDQASPPKARYKPEALKDGGIAAAIGLLIGLFLSIVVDQLREPFEALRRRSITDKLSGAFTQTHFRRLIDQEIAANPTEPLSLALLELEGMQELLQVIPEPILSQLLHKVTDILRKQLRGNDIVGKWIGARYALLLPGTPGKAAARTMERIRQVLTEPISLEAFSESIQLNPCIGLTERLAEDEPSSQLIQRAENALEQAKQSEQKLVFYAPADLEGVS